MKRRTLVGVLRDSTSLEYEPLGVARPWTYLGLWLRHQRQCSSGLFPKEKKETASSTGFHSSPRQGCPSLQPRFPTQDLPDIYLFSGRCARCWGHGSGQGRCDGCLHRACSQAGAVDKGASPRTVIKTVMGV